MTGCLLQCTSSAHGPELTSRDVCYLVAIRCIADIVRTSSEDRV